MRAGRSGNCRRATQSTITSSEHKQAVQVGGLFSHTIKILLKTVKLIVQIALGVFLGTLAAQLSIDSWRNYRQAIANQETEKRRADQERARLEQAERIRALLLQGRSGKKASNASNPAADFVPDDAPAGTVEKNR